MSDQGKGFQAWIERRGLIVVAVTPLLAHLVGSAFNIWYNQRHIRPLLTPDQLQRFFITVAVFNAIVYPLAVFFWFRVVMSLRPWYRRALLGEVSDNGAMAAARRRTINLPWGIAVIGGVAWLSCIPAFLWSISGRGEPIDARIYVHLPTSFLIAGSIAVTHSFFITEVICQRVLYPVMFRHARPSETPGAKPLSLTGRGLVWAFSAVVCPVCSLLLLFLAPLPAGEAPSFALIVGMLAILFGIVTAWLLGMLVARPVRHLTAASRRIAAGDLDTQVELKCADEFGPLVDEFNRMIVQLREKQRLQETFGRHVGHAAARQILARDPGAAGSERLITVMFADLRDFTPRAARLAPQSTVALLNDFLSKMVDIVEVEFSGMVNKFLGDGFMALFGAGEATDNHADAGVAAAIRMQQTMAEINAGYDKSELLELGIGIHTGQAIVGSVGSDRRLEYTAIGDTVNIASRVEALTKRLGHPIVMTEATRDHLQQPPHLLALPPQKVKGVSSSITVFAVP